MTLYALDLDKVHHTIRATLVDSVLPAIESGSARGELLAVVEMLDSLQTRLSWDPAALAAATARTQALGAALGVTADQSVGDSADGPDALREGRKSIGDALAAAYVEGAAGIDPAVVEAVALFTAEDITAEISPALLPGLPS